MQDIVKCETTLHGLVVFDFSALNTPTLLINISCFMVTMYVILNISLCLSICGKKHISSCLLV